MKTSVLPRPLGKRCPRIMDMSLVPSALHCGQVSVRNKSIVHCITEPHSQATHAWEPGNETMHNFTSEIPHNSVVKMSNPMLTLKVFNYEHEENALIGQFKHR